MRVLLTGGAGYVGSTLTPILLADGHHVRVLDSLLHGGESLLSAWTHPNFEFHHGDVRDAAAMRAALSNIDAVVHLAAIVGDPACARDPETARTVNRDASLALLDAARASGVKRFVFASTCSNYGKMLDSSGYVDETSPLAPVSLYAETKVAVERTMLDQRSTNGMALTALRFATVFGVSPRMRFDLTVNEFTAEMIVRKRLVVFGEQFWRPYVHVRDAANGIALVLSTPTDRVAGRVYNVGSTELNYRKQDLVQLIQVQAPDAAIEYVHRNEDPRDYRVSFARIGGELGYKTTRSVEDGIREVATLVRSGVVGDVAAERYRN